MSLPICIVAVVLSAISTLHPLRLSTTIDYYGSRADRADYEVHQCIGVCNGVIYGQTVRRGIPVPDVQVKAVAGYPAAYAPAKTLLGFGLLWTTAPQWRFREVDFPLWPIAVAGAIVPMRAYLRRRQSRWAGLCRVCHYDLTGNASGVCPECGTAVA